MRRLNWLFFPIFYPIAVIAGLLTMLTFLCAFGWRFPVRWYMKQAYRLTISIILGDRGLFFGRPD